MNKPYIPNLLCSDSELEFLVREITKQLKFDNDYADWQKVGAPRTPEEWKAYGKRNPNW